MLESTTKPETGEVEPAKPAESKGDALRELARQFTLDDDAAEPAETPPAEGAKPTARKGKPKTLTELAERLELDVADVYGIKIASDKVEGLTLGKLKDLAAEHETFTVRSLALEEQAAKRDADHARARSELELLMSALPEKALKPEVLETVRKRHAAAMETERKRTLEAIPEWADEALRDQELAAMGEHLADYGFPASYLKTIGNHRFIKYVRDNWQRTERLRKALELVTEKKPKAQGKSGPAPAPGQRANAQKPALSRDEREVKRYLATLNGQR